MNSNEVNFLNEVRKLVLTKIDGFNPSIDSDKFKFFIYELVQSLEELRFTNSSIYRILLDFSYELKNPCSLARVVEGYREELEELDITLYNDSPHLVREFIRTRYDFRILDDNIKDFICREKTTDDILLKEKIGKIKEKYKIDFKKLGKL